ncbi:MAG: hypothetical protein WAU91_23075 [Desulfatitalea sp.]
MSSKAQRTTSALKTIIRHTALGPYMGKGARLKRTRREQSVGIAEKMTQLMTKNFQKELRNSEIWDQMVAQFGEEKAEQLLKECKAEVKPGGQF